MSRTTRFAAVALATLAGCAIALAQPAKETRPGAAKPAPDAKPAVAAQPKDKAQSKDKADHAMPAMSEADMQACMEAATPGPMHAFLGESVGVWQGKTTMWMGPGTEPMQSECTTTISWLMEGRYLKVEVDGDMPGMGPFRGFGINGYDNVSQKFQSTWADNFSTGMMTGTGELSADRKTMTWNFTYNCPITKKPAKMREVERRTGPDTMVFEMHGTDPASGKEYKMMEIAYTRKAQTAGTKAPALRGR